MNLVFPPYVASFLRSQGKGDMSRLATFLILEGAKYSCNLDGWSDLEETAEQVRRGKRVDISKLKDAREVIEYALEEGDWRGREEYSRPRPDLV